MTNKFNLLFAVGVLVLISMACNFNFSTANLSDLTFGKDKDASGSTTNFNPEDEIFAITSVNNASGANKVKFRLLFDDVEGEKSGTLAYKVEKELKTDGSRKVWLNFSLPGGFASGTYRVEAVLTSEDGKEHDRKTATFTVGGGKTSKWTKPKADKKKDSTDESSETDGDTNETDSGDDK